jgi:hypothetical protein
MSMISRGSMRPRHSFGGCPATFSNLKTAPRYTEGRSLIWIYILISLSTSCVRDRITAA